MSFTDIDHLAIGSIAYSAQREHLDNLPASTWLVVDLGVHDDGSPYVDVLEEVPVAEVRVDVRRANAKQPTAVRLAVLRRVDLAEVSSAEEPSAQIMDAWAVKAAWGALAGHGRRAHIDWPLLYVAAGLMDEAKRLAGATKARIEAELAEARAVRDATKAAS